MRLNLRPPGTNPIGVQRPSACKTHSNSLPTKGVSTAVMASSRSVENIATTFSSHFPFWMYWRFPLWELFRSPSPTRLWKSNLAHFISDLELNVALFLESNHWWLHVTTCRSSRAQCRVNLFFLIVLEKTPTSSGSVRAETSRASRLHFANNVTRSSRRSRVLWSLYRKKKSLRSQDSWDYCPWSCYQMGWCFLGFALAVPMEVLTSTGRIPWGLRAMER